MDAWNRLSLSTKDGKKEQKTDLFTIGIGSVIIGALCSTFFPMPIMVYGLYSIGVLSTAAHFVWPKNNFKVLFDNCGLHKGEMYPELQEKIITAYGHCLRFSLPLGLSSDDFTRHKKAIEQFLDRKIEIKYSHKNILIEVYNTEVKSYEFRNVETKGILAFPVGISFRGIETIDISEASPHMLIAGESGSGKSTALRSILTNLILNKDPKQLQLHLIDLKMGAEFNIFRKCEIVKSFSRTIDEAYTTLYKISQEVDRRYNLFFENDCVDIKEYNAKFKKKQLEYQLVVIDEYADLQDEKDTQRIAEELAAKARACGIHLIISTQRPDSKILNGRIKANVPVVLGLKTMNEVNSRIIIDHGGLELLNGKGHGILKTTKEIEIQSMNLSAAEARDLLRSKYRFNGADGAQFLPAQKAAGEVENFDFLKNIKRRK